MKAIVSRLVGGPDTLTFEDIDKPVASATQVIIDIKAVSVNFPDALAIQGLHQIKPKRPFSPGSEVAGIVSSIGPSVSRFKQGDRVVAMPGTGGMAEQVAVDESRCFAIDETMPYNDAAALIVTYGTSHYALVDRCALKPNETVLVLGASGGVGLAAIQIAKARGAKVVAACSTQEKLDLCLAQGADVGLVYPYAPLDRTQQKKLSKEIMSLSDGLDVVYDAIGGDYCEPALRCMNWRGRYAVIGFMAGIPNPPLNLALLNAVDIVTIFWGPPLMDRTPQSVINTVQELLSLYADRKIKPHVSNTYSLENGALAIADLLERRATGKIVVTNP